MKRLSKKLHSQSGASILLALLMLLVCCMVAASVLAAAASNAGKARSNRVEQQKYLTLSSAIQLVADEIQKNATYTGKYKVYEWTEEVLVGTDEDGNDITQTYYYYHIAQVEGVYSCGDLTTVLPLGKELDEIFKHQFTGTGYTALSDVEDSPTPPRTLTVTLPSGPNELDGYPYAADDSAPGAYEVSKVTTVQVELNHSTHHITLTAWLGPPPPLTPLTPNLPTTRATP